MIVVTCGRCGSILGRADSMPEATGMQREHIVDCEVIS